MHNSDKVLDHPSGACPVHTVVAENYDVNQYGRVVVLLPWCFAMSSPQLASFAHGVTSTQYEMDDLEWM